MPNRETNHQTPQSVLPTRLTSWVRNWIVSQGGAPTALSLERLAGDGSTRCFYRLHLPTESGKTQEALPKKPGDGSFIVLHDPEWILSKDYPAHQAYLAERSLPVPRFFSIDPPAGCLVMEDLGDVLLQHRLLSSPEERMNLLGRAARLLAELHGRTFPVPSALPVTTRKFDAAKYSTELDYTWEHLHRQLLGFAPPSEKARAEAVRYCEEIARIEPWVFAHRDYHTRNILYKGGDLFLIDFQDARLGPPHYDLASLLYDPYVPISSDERKELFSAYRETLRPYALFSTIGWDSFTPDLERVAFQRVVKAAGSYASFFTRNGKKTHLPYLRPALDTALSLVEGGSVPQELSTAFELPRLRAAIEKQL